MGQGENEGKAGGKSVETHQNNMRNEGGGSAHNEDDDDDDDGGQPPKKSQKHMTTGRARARVLKKLPPDPKSKHT